MNLKSVTISNVRKIASADLALNPATNIFTGANGSGKTSVLEALYLLCGGRSFRTARSREIIRHNTDALTVTGDLAHGEQSSFIGVEKTKSATRLRLNEENVKSASQVVRQLPMLVINTESFRLLEGGPSNRRDLIDRLLFHVEPKYLGYLRQYYHVLKQRNAGLRKNFPEKEIRLWDDPLCESGLVIDQLRTKQVAILNQAVAATGIQAITGNLQLHYEKGWKKGESMASAVASSIDRDRALGTTVSGPHRAELKVNIDERPAKASLSRGQIKLVVTALIAAMSQSISEASGISPILLVDDLASELDMDTKSKAIQLLMGLKTQAFFTAIEYNLLSELAVFNPGLFHVEQGRLTSVS